MDRDSSHRSTIALSPAHAASSSTSASRITPATLATAAHAAKETAIQATLATQAAQQLASTLASSNSPHTTQLANIHALPTAHTLITATSTHAISITSLAASIPTREATLSIAIEPPASPTTSTSAATAKYYHPDTPIQSRDVLVADTEEVCQTCVWMDGWMHIWICACMHM